jgi:hypothetical protein
VYEAMIYAVSAALLGGLESFALPIVGWILFVNALTLSGLYAIYQVTEAFTPHRRRATLPSATRSDVG